MRQHLLESFDKFWIENMHGDRNKTEYAPDGSTSETVFAVQGFSPGIRQGIVVGLAVKTGKPGERKIVRHRDDINAGRAETRRQQLLNSLTVAPFDDQYEIADPQRWNRLSFRPLDVASTYLTWPKLSNLAMLKPINGLMEKRGGALIDADRSALATRMQTYFDKTIDWPAFELMGNALAMDAARYKAKETRTKALAVGTFDDKQIVRYLVRPFDVRYAYFTEIRPIWNESRPQLWTQFSGGNQFVMSRRSGVANPEGPPMFFTRCLGDNDAQRGHSYYFPFRQHDPNLGMLAGTTAANLSRPTRAWLKRLGMPDPDKDVEAEVAPWHHALAITYAPQYLRDNADGIAIDWPRIPLPEARPLLDNSVTLGAQVAALLYSVADVRRITTGAVAQHFRVLGGISSTDLSVKAGWGSNDSKGRINPGRGRITMRNWTKTEKVALRTGFVTHGIGEARGFALLGCAIDVHLNDTTFWRAVPEAAWNYVIGGYLVIKKWLSYREKTILGRPLTKDEAREVTAMVRRLTALILLSDQLDTNYVACRDNAYSWPAA